MIRFEVTNSGEYWDVVGFNPDNPGIKVLANRSENRAYAEMLAADLNALDDVEPAKTESDELTQAIKQEAAKWFVALKRNTVQRCLS